MMTSVVRFAVGIESERWHTNCLLGVLDMGRVEEVLFVQLWYFLYDSSSLMRSNNIVNCEVTTMTIFPIKHKF